MRIATLSALVAVLVLLTGYVLIADRPFGLDLSREAIESWIKSLGPYGGLGVAALMVVHSFVPFPAELVVLVAGLVFGTSMGALYSWIGAMIGALLCFALARCLGRDAVLGLLTGKQQHRLDTWIRGSSTEALLAARLIPVVSFNMVNYGAGLTSIAAPTFLWTTAIGILPMTLAMAFCGAHMMSLSWRDWGFVAVAGICIWGAVVLVRRRWRT